MCYWLKPVGRYARDHRMGESMNVTEILITGFDGEEPVFAVNLSSDVATVAPTSSDEDGNVVLDEVRQQATDAFEAIWKILERLTKVQVSA
jgi:hypothetical protein